MTLITVQTQRWLGPGSPCDTEGRAIADYKVWGLETRVPLTVRELRELRERIQPICDALLAEDPIGYTATALGSDMFWKLGMHPDRGADCLKAYTRWAKSMVIDSPIHTVWMAVLRQRLRVVAVDGESLSTPIIMPYLGTRGMPFQLRMELSNYEWSRSGKRK